MACNLASCGFDSDLSGLPNYDYSTNDCYYLNAGDEYIPQYASEYALCVLTSDLCERSCDEWFNTEVLAWDVGLCGYCAQHCEG